MLMCMTVSLFGSTKIIDHPLLCLALYLATNRSRSKGGTNRRSLNHITDGADSSRPGLLDPGSLLRGLGMDPMKSRTEPQPNIRAHEDEYPA